jgi:hypothetical protein
MYAEMDPASGRKSVFDSEQSPQKMPARCSRTSSSTRASISCSAEWSARGLENRYR